MLEVFIKTNLGKFSLEINTSITNGITAFYGPSGSGKTSVATIIAGLIKAKEAKISIGGKVLSDTSKNIFYPAHRRKIGYVFQDSRLFPHLNVMNNLKFGTWFLSKKLSKSYIDSIVELLDLQTLVKRKTYNLSGGEKQRIAIGRALLMQPKVLLMDEPLSSLDPELKAGLIPYIVKLNRELSIPIIYVTHSLNEVLQLAQNIALFKEGRITKVIKTRDYFVKSINIKSKKEKSKNLLLGEVAKKDFSNKIIELKVANQKLYILYNKYSLGQKVIIKIDEKGVVLSPRKPIDISCLNILYVKIKNIKTEGSLVKVELNISADTNAITIVLVKKAFDNAKLKINDNCYAIIKSMYIEESEEILAIQNEL